MTHLARAIGLLIIGIAVFVAVRMDLTPTSWGEYGFYRGENVEEWANVHLNYAETDSCQSCHRENYDLWILSAHQTVSCESCHGPGEKHVTEGTPLAIDRSQKLCGLCHAKLISRPSDFPQVDLEQHAGQLTCITCHTPHSPALGSASTSTGLVAPKVPHTLEGRPDCLLCHGAEGIKPFPENHAGRTSSTCLSCHEGGQR